MICKKQIISLFQCLDNRNANLEYTSDRFCCSKVQWDSNIVGLTYLIKFFPILYHFKSLSHDITPFNQFEFPPFELVIVFIDNENLS